MSRTKADELRELKSHFGEWEIYESPDSFRCGDCRQVQSSGSLIVWDPHWHTAVCVDCGYVRAEL